MVLSFMRFLFVVSLLFGGGSDASLEFCVAFLCCFAVAVLESLFVKVAMELFCVKKECHSPCKSTVTLKRNDLHHASSGKLLCFC